METSNRKKTTFEHKKTLHTLFSGESSIPEQSCIGAAGRNILLSAIRGRT